MDAKIPIQPIVRAEDKGNIGSFLEDAPDDLQFLGQIDFIDLERNDLEYWELGLGKVSRFLTVRAGVDMIGDAQASLTAWFVNLGLSATKTKEVNDSGVHEHIVCSQRNLCSSPTQPHLLQHAVNVFNSRSIIFQPYCKGAGVLVQRSDGANRDRRVARS